MPRCDLPAIGALRAEGENRRHDHEDKNAAGFRLGIPGDGRSSLRPGVARLDGVVPTTGSAQPDCGTLSGGWQRSSGTGCADGGIVGTACGSGFDAGPDFDCEVPPNGYAWWYIDALSDDGCHALTVIALVGSVFSPYYARVRRRGSADPLDHCAFNVALYGPNGKRWAMTERGRNSLSRTQSQLTISRSTISLEEGDLSLFIDEIGVPVPRRIRGTIRLRPLAVGRTTYRIDDVGRHLWHPIAPTAAIEVNMTYPSLQWSGHGYFDHNRGASPLEDDFSRWTWTRFALEHGSAIAYDTKLRDGRNVSLALHFDPNGEVSRFEPPRMVDMKPTGWRMKRELRSEISDGISVRTLEDTPFYARSAIDAQLFGKPVTGMHESLSLDRFRSRLVQWMLPFRMPRRA
jgi:carotenoid 1,2-hydratase